MTTRFSLNGVVVESTADPLTPIGQVLTEDHGLTSIRLACDVGACGACTVVIDGRPVKSCLRPIGLAQGQSVLTSEGLPSSDPVQRAFAAAGAFQCAYCVPGFVMTVHGLLLAGETLDDAALRQALAGNICRCGSYGPILEASAALLRRPAEVPPPSDGDPV